MAERGEAPAAWERREDESAEAREAFVVYRDLGAKRTYVAAAAALGKSVSLLRRWAERHDWPARVFAWDRAQDEADATTVRQVRNEMIERSLRDASNLKRMAMGTFGGLVRRDPATGELLLDKQVTPRMAVSFYKLALDIEESVARAGADGGVAEGQGPEAMLRTGSDAELHELLELAKTRAQEKKGGRGNGGN